MRTTKILLCIVCCFILAGAVYAQEEEKDWGGSLGAIWWKADWEYTSFYGNTIDTETNAFWGPAISLTYKNVSFVVNYSTGALILLEIQSVTQIKVMIFQRVWIVSDGI